MLCYSMLTLAFEFFPGWDDISKLFKLLTEDAKFRLDPGLTRIYPLHSLMPTIDQKAIFNRPPPGVRKIVLATNIAGNSSLFCFWSLSWSVISRFWDLKKISLFLKMTKL